MYSHPSTLLSSGMTKILTFYHFAPILITDIDVPNIAKGQKLWITILLLQLHL